MLEYATPPRYTPGPQELIVDDVFAKARAHPERTAVSRRVDGQWVSVSCLELADDIEALAAGLIIAGIQPGERVALMSRTRYEWLLYDFAIMSIGAVTVPIYETSSAEQVEWILSDSGAVAAIVETEEQYETIKGMRERLPAVRDLWHLVDYRYRLIEAGFGAGPQAQAERRQTMGPESLATIVYTSGTTGMPKGCMLTHGNLLSLVHNDLAADGVYEKVFNERESALLFLPLAHVLARVIQISALHAGVRLGHTDMTNVVADLQSFKPTVILSVPRVFEKLYNTARHKATVEGKKKIFDKAEQIALGYSESLDDGGPGIALRLEHKAFEKLVYGKILHAMGGNVRWAVSGGAPLGSHLGHFLRGAGVNVLEGWGLTESTAGGTLNLPEQQRIGSTGRPIPGCSVRIAPDGEILMKGPYIFAGYWRNEVATKEVLDADGWFSTGDVGHLDDDGFLFITDRKKDLIVTSAGKNVAPAMLEDRLRAHWLVSQALVVGDGRAYVGALLTVDEEALATWQSENGKPAVDAEAMADDADFVAAVQEAVDAANAAVSQAEAIKRWNVLPKDFTVEGGEVTPTLKLRRSLVTQRYAEQVEQLYS